MDKGWVRLKWDGRDGMRCWSEGMWRRSEVELECGVVRLQQLALVERT